MLEKKRHEGSRDREPELPRSTTRGGGQAREVKAGQREEKEVNKGN